MTRNFRNFFENSQKFPRIFTEMSKNQLLVPQETEILGDLIWKFFLGVGGGGVGVKEREREKVYGQVISNISINFSQNIYLSHLKKKN